MLAVARIRVDVLRWPRPLGGVGRRVPRSGAAGQRSLDPTGPQRTLPHIHECHAVALHRDADDRPVDGAFGELLERPPAPPRLGAPPLAPHPPPPPPHSPPPPGP